jgi:inhibitor of cysteine peptidase
MTPTHKRRFWALSLVLPLLLLVAGCSLLGQTEEPTPTATNPPPTTEVDQEPETTQVTVESLEILLLESFPVQVNAIVSGNLPDGCSTLNEPRPRREGNTFVINLVASRLPDEVCTQALVPFDQVIPLDVAGLPAGTYTVSVNGTTDTFTLDVDNIVAEETPEVEETSEAEATPTAVAESGATITGLVWHDLCSISGGAGEAAAVPSAGCVALDEGGYAANGLVEDDEPGLGGVTVGLGSGRCPAAETETVVTDDDGVYRFTGLEAGTYCVSVDALSNANSSLLIPGDWTAPESDAGVGLTYATVAVDEDQTAEEINFGWDYQFLPLPAGQAGASKGCVDAANFIADVTVLDNEVLPPSIEFTKTWRLENAGTCTWNSDYQLVFVAGDQMGGPASIPLPGEVVPTDTVDLSVNLIAPEADGTYRGDWALRNDIGELFGIPGNLEFWALIEVNAEVIPEGANIEGLIWSDLCPSTTGNVAPEGCVAVDDGEFVANGIYDAGEPRIRGVTVALGEGACPATTVTATQATDQAGRFRFTGLEAGTYCIFINAAGGNNVTALGSGVWSWPENVEGDTAAITVEVEEFYTAMDNWFGWDPAAD